VGWLAGCMFREVGSSGFSKAMSGMAGACSGLALLLRARHPCFVWTLLFGVVYKNPISSLLPRSQLSQLLPLPPTQTCLLSSHLPCTAPVCLTSVSVSALPPCASLPATAATNFRLQRIFVEHDGSLTLPSCDSPNSSTD
jgi:hypothetical protein